jgi:transposase
VSNEAKRPSRKGRPNHPIDFKRCLAQQACETGISVSRLAQEHGINANLLFKWRRHYLAGLFDQPRAGMPLLPVTLISPPSAEVVAKPAALPATGAASGIEVVFADCTVRIGSCPDTKTLRAVLALLRQ